VSSNVRSVHAPPGAVELTNSLIRSKPHGQGFVPPTRKANRMPIQENIPAGMNRRPVVRGGSLTFPSAGNYGTTIFMKRSIKVAPKMRRGRPPSGGRDPHITIRMPAALIAEADAWGVANDTGRSEAIRRLVELGLKAK
jgi:hypothetical protein